MTVGRWTLPLLGVSAAMLIGLVPATAGATDYCVAPNTDCGGTLVPNVEQALDLADNATDADRVILGAATYTAPTPAGFAYNESSSPVEIIGKGAGQTIFTAPAGASSVLSLTGGPGSSVHDLKIRIPQNAADGSTGLSTANSAQRIDVVEDPTQANSRRGAELVNGGKLEDSTVTIGSAQPTTAVVLNTGGSLRRSTVSASAGVESKFGGTIQASRVIGAWAGVFAKPGATTIRASVIRFSNADGGGIGAVSGPTTVNADGVTVIGPGTASAVGVSAIADGLLPHPVDVNLTNSIIRGASKSLWALAIGKTGQAHIAASYSDYDPTGNFIGAANATITETNVSNVGDAGFVDASNGNYHLLPASTLIDSGDPTVPQGLDFDGNPLVVDGNGDGIARRDIGAFELQPTPPAPGDAGPGGGGAPTPDTQPPLITGFKPRPAVFAVARAGTPLAARAPRGTRFRYTLSEPAAVRLTIQRRLAGRRSGGRCVRPSPRLLRAKRCVRYRSVGSLKRSGAKGANGIRFTGRIGSRALRPGSYLALITATDAAGNRSARRAAGFRIAG